MAPEFGDSVKLLWHSEESVPGNPRTPSQTAIGLSCLALAFSVSILTTPARAEFFTRPYESIRADDGQLTLSPTVRFYSTTTNYGPDGTEAAVEGLQSYRRLQTDVVGAYGISTDLTLFGQFNWSRVQLDSAESVVNFRPGNQTIGLSYRVMNTRGGMDVSLQGQVDFPLYDNEQSALNGEPFMGDGSIDSSLGAFGTLPLNHNRSWKIHGGLGYSFRTDGYSAALPWSVNLVHASRGDTLVIRAGFNGVTSLNTDSRLATDAAVSTGGVGAGGSYYIDAMNPSILNVQLQAGYQLSEGLGLNASFVRSLWGQAAPVGTQVAFGIRASLSPGKRSASPSKDREKYQGSNQGFVSYAFEARVVKTNDRLNLVKIDQGSDAGVKVGQVFDIFSIKADGSIDEAVARARVTHVKPTEAALKIVEYFREVWIEERFIVKRPLN